MECTIYNRGAINKNVNSIGSVIPVKNEVNAAEPYIPNANFLFSGFTDL